MTGMAVTTIVWPSADKNIPSITPIIVSLICLGGSFTTFLVIA